MKNEKLWLGILAMVFSMTALACNSVYYRMPDGINRYSETVDVPGMEQDEIFRKVTLYWVNSGKGVDINVSEGQYRANFVAAQTSTSNAALVNAEREKMYLRAAELRKAVYSFPLDDDEQSALFTRAQAHGRRGEAQKAMELYYQIVIADPFNIPAMVFYGASLGDLNRYADAITVLGFVSNEDGVQNMLTQLKILEQNRLTQLAIQQAAEAERQRIAAEQQRLEAERQRQAQAEAQAQLEQSLANSAAMLAQYNQGRSGAGGSASSNTAGGANASSYMNRYSNWEQRAKRYIDDYYKYSGRASGNDAGSLRLVNDAKRGLRDAARQMESIRREAQQAGVTIPMSPAERDAYALGR